MTSGRSRRSTNSAPTPRRARGQLLSRASGRHDAVRSPRSTQHDRHDAHAWHDQHRRNSNRLAPRGHQRRHTHSPPPPAAAGASPHTIGPVRAREHGRQTPEDDDGDAWHDNAGDARYVATPMRSPESSVCFIILSVSSSSVSPVCRVDSTVHEREHRHAAAQSGALLRAQKQVARVVGDARSIGEGAGQPVRPKDSSCASGDFSGEVAEAGGDEGAVSSSSCVVVVGALARRRESPEEAMVENETDLGVAVFGGNREAVRSKRVNYTTKWA
ncbi:hypothetical protein C8J57DRAFT_1514323 [Mycena rebaudengoi]|nr:hypothetical protein C8J57DRAFT_1514323 [Mycena rebaudengoi]